MNPTGIEWLRGLNDELWPTEQQRKGGGQTRHGWVQIKLHALRRLTPGEWQRVVDIIAKENLIVEMFGTSMFGGVGIRLYEHPQAPGIDQVEFVVLLTQDHLPSDEEPEATGGSCLRSAWEVFHTLSTSGRNLEWLERYGLRQPKEATHYDY